MSGNQIYLRKYYLVIFDIVNIDFYYSYTQTNSNQNIWNTNMTNLVIQNKANKYQISFCRNQWNRRKSFCFEIGICQKPDITI